MRTKHHLIASLVDNGMDEKVSEDLADDAYATDEPRRYLNDRLTEVDAQIQGLTIFANSIRRALEGTSHAPQLEATVR